MRSLKKDCGTNWIWCSALKKSSSLLRTSMIKTQVKSRNRSSLINFKNWFIRRIRKINGFAVNRIWCKWFWKNITEKKRKTLRRSKKCIKIVDTTSNRDFFISISKKSSQKLTKKPIGNSAWLFLTNPELLWTQSSFCECGKPFPRKKTMPFRGPLVWNRSRILRSGLSVVAFYVIF